jgi:hypothetical protein
MEGGGSFFERERVCDLGISASCHARVETRMSERNVAAREVHTSSGTWRYVGTLVSSELRAACQRVYRHFSPPKVKSTPLPTRKAQSHHCAL